MNKMESFIRDTKHRHHQLDNVDEIAKKFLCTQLPTFVDYKQIYPFISDDLDSINFRVPGIMDEYAHQRFTQPKLLAELVGGVIMGNEIPPIFTNYINEIKPPKGKETLFFFLHGQRKKNLADHIDFNVSDLAERKRLFNAIQKYQVPPEMHMKDIVESIGNFMFELKIGNCADEEEEEEREGTGRAQRVEEEDEIDQNVQLPTNATLPFNETDHWENPVLKAFKIDAGLSTRFSSEKTIKQLLIASTIPQLCTDAKFTDNFGKHQVALPEINFDAHTIDGFPINYIDHLPEVTINQIVQMKEAQDLYHGLLVKPKESRELVKSLLLSQHPTLYRFVQVSKNYKKPTKLNEGVGKLIL